MRQDISEKLADILEYGTPLLDGVHDAGEKIPGTVYFISMHV
jgi:hypothetical protein